jgi:hypothetical protein
MQTVDVQNGNGTQILSTAITGGTWQYPTDIHTGGHDGEYLLLHSKVSIYLYWGDNAPPRPPGCAAIYGGASLEFQKLVGFNWITTGATGTHSDSLTRSTPGTTLETRYLHVWNDTIPLSNMDLYRLMIYSVGGWIDTGGVYHPDNSPVTTYEYYRIKVP